MNQSRINKLILGGVIGFGIGILTPISVFIFPNGFAGPIDSIFHYLNNIILKSQNTDTSSILILVLITIECIILGFLVTFLLDKSYFYINKIKIFIIFIIMFILVPYFFVSIYNFYIISNLNKNSDIETCYKIIPDIIYNNYKKSDECISKMASYHTECNGRSDLITCIRKSQGYR